MNTEIEWTLWILAGTAVILSFIYNKTSKPHWFLLKLIGVVSSTIPIIGVLQGGMFMEKDPPHSRACFYQTALAVLAFVILHYGLGVVDI